MLSSTNTPIFVDFGFAQKWDVNAIDTGANTLIGGLNTLTGHNASCHELFQSEISWGTPEYLDPQRAKGLRHDERASDVWALGVSPPEPSRCDTFLKLILLVQVTFFEILVGRTPFEESEDEQFSTTEQLSVYYDRTVKGEWMGDWSMSAGKCEEVAVIVRVSYHFVFNSHEGLA
jgi:protein-serine/threonine kinase